MVDVSLLPRCILTVDNLEENGMSLFHRMVFDWIIPSLPLLTYDSLTTSSSNNNSTYPLEKDNVSTKDFKDY